MWSCRFVAVFFLLLGLFPSASHASDFDGDGDSDLLVISGDPNLPFRSVILSSLGSFPVLGCGGTAPGICGLPTGAVLQHPKTQLLEGRFNTDTRADLLLISGDPNEPLRTVLTANTNGTGFDAACSSEGSGCGIGTAPYMFHPNTHFLAGNFDGDAAGLTDLLIISGDPNFPMRRLLLADPNGSGFNESCAGVSGLPCGISIAPYTLHRHTHFVLGDYDGNGRMDLLVVSGDVGDTTNTVLLGSAGGFTEACNSSQGAGCGINNAAFSREPRTRYIPMDFDGDADTDLVVIGAVTQTWRELHSWDPNTSRFGSLCAGSSDGTCGLDTEPDVNFPETRWFVGEFIGSGGVPDAAEDLLMVSRFPDPNRAGDDKDRRAVYQFNGSQFTRVCTDSIGGANSPCNLPIDPTWTFPRSQLVAEDFDGNGRTDLLVISGDLDARERALYLATGSGEAGSPIFAPSCFGAGVESCMLSTADYWSHVRTRVLPHEPYQPPKIFYASTIYDPVSITTELRLELFRRTGELIFDGPQGRVYTTAYVLVRDGQVIRIDPGITIEAETDGVPYGQGLFTTSWAKQVRFIGDLAGGSTIRLKQDEYIDNSQFRAGITIKNAIDVEVDGLNILDTGGDGIDISPWFPPFNLDFPPYAKDVTIRNVLTENVSRMPFAATSVINLLVENFVGRDAAPFFLVGTANCGTWCDESIPKSERGVCCYQDQRVFPDDPDICICGAGLDGAWNAFLFEPFGDHGAQVGENIIIRNSEFEDLFANGIVFNVFAERLDLTHDLTATIENVTIRNVGQWGFKINLLSDSIPGSIEFKNVEIDGSAGPGIHVQDHSAEGLRTRFENVILRNPNQDPNAPDADTAPIYVKKQRNGLICSFNGPQTAAFDDGNVELANVSIVGNSLPNAVELENAGYSLSTCTTCIGGQACKTCGSITRCFECAPGQVEVCADYLVDNVFGTVNVQPGESTQISLGSQPSGIGVNNIQFVTGAGQLQFNDDDLNLFRTVEQETPFVLTLDNANGAAVSFQLASSAGWVTPVPASGTTPEQVSLVFDFSGIAPGVHNATVAATSPQAGGTVVSITLNLFDVCGNGVLTPPDEQCDDGNRDIGDGCDGNCKVEGCHVCAGEPSVCSCNSGLKCGLTCGNTVDLRCQEILGVCECAMSCELFGGDDDQDGVCQDLDNCPDTAVAAQDDDDADGLGDACDCTFVGVDEDCTEEIFTVGICVSGNSPQGDPGCTLSDMDSSGVVDALDLVLVNACCNNGVPIE